MYTIIGASGRVGSAIVANLLAQKQQVRAIIHDPAKADKFKQQGATTAIADAFNSDELTAAVKGTDVLFVITPETGKNDDVIADTKTILANYHSAIKANGIKKVVGLSSSGAHLPGDTGNLKMSYLLEHAFEDLPITQVFIRPVYYYSNWLMGLDEVKKTGILPTFYPEAMTIPMIAPHDVACFATGILQGDEQGKVIYELEGPGSYSSYDVANALAHSLKQDVNAQQIPPAQWNAALKKMGFSADGASQFIKMTKLVIEGKTRPEGIDTVLLRAETTLQQFIDHATLSK